MKLPKLNPEKKILHIQDRTELELSSTNILVPFNSGPPVQQPNKYVYPYKKK